VEPMIVVLVLVAVILSGHPPAVVWWWRGQGSRCNRVVLVNLKQAPCPFRAFLVHADHFLSGCSTPSWPTCRPRPGRAWRVVGHAVIPTSKLSRDWGEMVSTMGLCRACGWSAWAERRCPA